MGCSLGSWRPYFRSFGIYQVFRSSVVGSTSTPTTACALPVQRGSCIGAGLAEDQKNK